MHACWEAGHVARLRGVEGSVVDLSRRFADEIEAWLAEDGTLDRAAQEDGVDLTDPEKPPPLLLPALAERNVRRQGAHPIKVLTSGLETRAAAPFFAGGRWRFESRVPWWDSYGGPMAVVCHYWRSRNPTAFHGKRPDLFAGTRPRERLGRAGRVMCVDYSIGKRSQERASRSAGFESALAAYRWPEAELTFSPI